VSAANTWIVGPLPSDDFLTIEEALQSPQVLNNDVIRVKSGTYRESLNVNKRVTIEAYDSNIPIIKPNSQYHLQRPIIDINEHDITIKNLILNGSLGQPYGYPPAGIRSDITATEHYNIEIENVEITYCDYGILIKRTNPSYSYPLSHDIYGCYIHHNKEGIHIESDPDEESNYCAMIEETDVANNCLNNDPLGIHIIGDKNYIKNSIIRDHYYNTGNGYLGLGLYLQNSDNNEIYKYGAGSCNIYNNYEGILYNNSDNNEMTTVSIFTNGESDIPDYIKLYYSEDNEFTNLNIHDNEGIIKLNHSNVNTFNSCTIEDNECDYGGEDSSWIQVYDDSDYNTFSGCSFSCDDCTCYIQITYNSDHNTFQNPDCDFDGIILIQGSTYTTIEGYAIECSEVTYDSDYTVFKDCVFGDSSGTVSLSRALNLLESDHCEILYCDIIGADTGFLITDCDDVLIDGHDEDVHEGHSSIENCDVILDVDSDSVATDVSFGYFDIEDHDDLEDDVELTGNPSYSTLVTASNLYVFHYEGENKMADTLEISEDAYSTWDYD
jgi:hypothetical protein